MVTAVLMNQQPPPPPLTPLMNTEWSPSPSTTMSAIKMDELLVTHWLGSDSVYSNVLEWMEHAGAATQSTPDAPTEPMSEPTTMDSTAVTSQTTRTHIPPFYPEGQQMKVKRWLRRNGTGVAPGNSNNNPNISNSTSSSSSLDHHPSITSSDAFAPQSGGSKTYLVSTVASSWDTPSSDNGDVSIRQLVQDAWEDLGVPSEQTGGGNLATTIIPMEQFHLVTKDICQFPSFFNVLFYQRILEVWIYHHPDSTPAPQAVTIEMMEFYWKMYMEPYDVMDRFFYLVKSLAVPDHIVRDDFLPFVQALLREHPGLEFLSSHAEFQEKYAVTVVTRIFYSVNTCHTGRITSRQIRHSDLYEAFLQVDQEEDINKVTRYFSYEHFYVLYCRFWELDHDRDYRITREDLLKYGDHSLSHMIVDRIFDAAPRPFIYDSSSSNSIANGKPNHRDYLSYEDFIYFMLSEEDKSNEVAVRYWFQCVDVDGDGKLNNMEMRSFYAVQLHRMSCMGHETVPFEDMLCQMMDMMKPASTEYLVVNDFLQAECCNVSGALFDALFSLNKYMLFEQRDPFNERQKREDEFQTDWDRFACMDYNRLAMEEEAREEEAMEIDWVTVDDEEDDDLGGGSSQSAELADAPSLSS
jgi:serine/threonine-protein phosphatase 2A regulatory subunit B''